ncbi:alpha/beta fold hydrolase [Poritiphilus flavus]|uniref:Alpha/beta fold hydrolase n=1 Tax=Poritiphilus flavus TaxID=2697053 RepID=A0A6L9EEW5_9FLAO|nr:alpha/beta hydrolase [Poritiphilus flavus]NAS13277.1 alpha/beta fold hydrolase [Poritiphilus flavus]
MQNLSVFTRVHPLLSICLLLAFIGCGQSSGEIEKPEQSPPEMVNWFLASGDWERDPQLYVREYGTGQDTVIMLHGGWGASHDGFVNAVRDLRQDHRFIFYEQRGSLRSPFPDSLISYQAHIDDLEKLRIALQLEKVTLVGHSMGSVLASAYASAHPDRIEKLVLMSPAYLKNPIPEEDRKIMDQAFLKSEAFRERPEIEDELDKYGLNRKSPPLNSKENTIRARISFAQLMLFDVSKWPELENGKALYKGHVYSLTERTYPDGGWDFIQEFARREYPVTIIHGDHDWLDFEASILKKWTTEVPRITLDVIEDAGHLPWIDQSEKITGALRKALSP